MDKQQFYLALHTELAQKHGVTPQQMKWIRSVALGKHLDQQGVARFMIEVTGRSLHNGPTSPRPYRTKGHQYYWQLLDVVARCTPVDRAEIVQPLIVPADNYYDDASTLVYHRARPLQRVSTYNPPALVYASPPLRKKLGYSATHPTLDRGKRVVVVAGKKKTSTHKRAAAHELSTLRRSARP